MSDINTKEKILDAAEKLFVDNGFSATSLRAIIKEAGVNTASVHYHFGSKEALVEAVFARRAAELNEERLDTLTRLEAEHGDLAVPLEDVLRTFLHPVVRRHRNESQDLKAFPELMGRASLETDPFYRHIMHNVFHEVFARFGEAVGRSLPGLSVEEVEWRMHMVIASMVFTIVVPRLHPEKSYTWSQDPDTVTERLVRFLAAGMRTPMPEAAGKESK